MKQFCYLVAALFSLAAQPSFSQSTPATGAPPTSLTAARSDAALNRLFQDLFPIQTDGTDYQTLFDNLAQLYSSPLDLNRATRDELAATLLFTERQLNSLMAYRTTSGDLLDLAELQAVPDFDAPSIQRIRPFVTIGAAPLTDGMPSPNDHSLLLRYGRVLEEQKGFTAAIAPPVTSGTTATKNVVLPQRYLGSPGQWYLRYRNSRPGTYSLGLTLEQDPGEPFRWNPDTRQYGVDFVSFHMQLQNRGRWRNVIVGDFQQQVGQGLVFSAGFSLGKNAETILTVRRPTLGARPYTSLTESGYLRGLSVTYSLTPSLELTLLAARNRRDANIALGKLIPDSSPADKTTGEEPLITSLPQDGLHQTASDLLDYRSVVETNVGGHLHLRRSQFQLGVTWLQTTVNIPIRKRTLAYNEFEFVGRQNQVVGLHGGYIWRNVNLFGEVAQSSGSLTHSRGIGAVAGVLASLNGRLDIALLARYYDPAFHSFYANGFGEAGRTINEKGVYGGIKYSLYRKLTISGFADWFRFPWAKYLVDAPLSGFDYLVSATYLPNRQTIFSLIFHDEYKAKNKPGSKSSPKELTGTIRRNLALTAAYTLAPGLTMRSRLQAGTFGYASSTTTSVGGSTTAPVRVDFTPAASVGFALIQDVSYDWGRLSLSGRVALFSTDDYDSRQYAYEQDVLYAFSFPAYFDRGVRHYLLARYQLGKHLDIWLRYARTDLFNKPDIGSDLDLINAPHKTDVKAQLRWRF